MSNKFEEMNYLVDKLKDKKQKELKRINNEFNDLFTKRKEEDYDYDVPDSWCVTKKTYHGRDINTFFMDNYFSDVREYERLDDYKYYRVCVTAEFRPKGFFKLLKGNKKNIYWTTTCIERDKIKKELVTNSDLTKELKWRNVFRGVNYGDISKDDYELKDISIDWFETEVTYPKPKVTFYYVTEEEIELLDQMKKDIINKYDRLIENVKMEYIPEHLWRELIK